MMRGEIQSTAVDVSVKFSFINDDILKMPEETLKQIFKGRTGTCSHTGFQLNRLSDPGIIYCRN
jgi:hypothetical protein